MKNLLNKKNLLTIVICSLCIVTLGFYFGFYKPEFKKIRLLQSQRADLQDEIDTIDLRLAKMAKMADGLQQLEQQSYMPAYDNLNEEINLLDSILIDADKYDLNFETAQFNLNNVRRNFTISFECNDYYKACYIIEKLESSKLRTTISNVNIIINEDEIVKVNLNATFYEILTN